MNTDQPPARLVVGICTFRRPAIAAAVKSVFNQSRLPDEIIVADNDDTPSAQAVIEDLQRDAPIKLTYLHVPGRNIAIVRNACLDAAGDARLAFLDDDEEATPEWLAELCAVMNEGYQAVFGPVRAQYPEEAPAWMVELAPHSQTVWRRNGEIQTGMTGNCLIDLAHPAFRGRRFDVAYGRTHGTDTDYFYDAFRAGGRFGEAPGAVVDEPVPGPRLEPAWIMSRRIEMGIAAARFLPMARPVVAASALAKAGIFGAGALLNWPNVAARHRLLWRAGMHIGVMRGAIGSQPRDCYGADDPSRSGAAV